MAQSWMQDLRLGFRALRKSPMFCCIAVVTLALGTGANTAIFSLLYGLLLRSLPVPEAAQVVRVGFASRGFDNGGRPIYLPYRTLEMLDRIGRSTKDHSFTELSAWSEGRVALPDNEGHSRFYLSSLVSGNAFRMLRLQPYLGRLLSPYDDVRGGPAHGWTAVVSYGFWNDYLGKDPGAIGRQIKLENSDVTVVGVAPPEFHGVWSGQDIQIYLPLQFASRDPAHDSLNNLNEMYGVVALARLSPGVTREQADAELATLRKDLFLRSLPTRIERSPFFATVRIKTASARTGVRTYATETYSKPLYLLQGLVGVVLILCCINVGGLMLSKVYAREREFAVSMALGARRWRLVRQYLTESFVIASAGALLGAAASSLGMTCLLHFFRDPMMGQEMEVPMDRSIFLVTGGFAILTTVLFGAIPAWRAGRADPGTLLKSRTSFGGRRSIAGRWFIPVQVALSLVLVVTASLLSQSMTRLRTEQTGFDVDHVTIQTSPLNRLGLHGEAMLNLYQRMVDRTEQMPGVDAAAAVSQTPLTGVEITSHFQALTSGPNPPEDTHVAFNDVGPGYFRTMKTQIVAGRDFDKNERNLDVCIVNQRAAKFFFPNQPAVGSYLRSLDAKEFAQPVSCRVIGLAEDAKFSNVRSAPPRTIYLPLSARRIEGLGNLVFLINSQTKAQAIAAFRQTISEIAPTTPLVIFVTLREQMDAALGSQHLMTILIDFFGALALLLSALGLYGLLSVSVVQRRAEIGVRIALGAERRSILGMVVKEAFALLLWGLGFGGLALYFASRFVVAMLYGVSSHDARTIAGVAGVLTLVTLAAALLPAFRAASVDPMQALRTE